MPPPLPPKPNFLIIGAAKAATTSLASLLDLHPEAAIVRPKEPHFFSLDIQYRHGWEAYLRLYEHCRGEKAVGDASTSYSRIRYHRETIPRIQRHMPGAKIIYMVRHPIERMESAYAEHRTTPGGGSFASINDAVRRQPMILDSSRYWEVFDAYRNAFGESNIKVVWFEEYASRTMAVFQDVCRFLEIDETFVPDLTLQRVNERRVAELDMAWDAELRRQVVAALREDNLRFLAHFGRPENHWGGVFRDR
ncbi:MAG TPA: sulfotransferase [Holophagaceae bacterium]|nr:sulfotransferase [Holophagaceae bacterium]